MLVSMSSANFCPIVEKNRLNSFAMSFGSDIFLLLTSKKGGYLDLPLR